MSLKEILPVVQLGAFAAAIALMLLLSVWWLSSGRVLFNRDSVSRPMPGPLWLAPLVIALSILPNVLTLHGGLPDLWPRAASQRILAAALVIGAAGLIEAFAGRSALLAVALRVGAAFFGFWAMIGPMPAAALGASPWVWILPLTVVAAAHSTRVDHLCRRADEAQSRGVGAWRNADVPLVLFIAAHALPLVLKNCSTAYHAQMAGGLAAVLGACVAAALLMPRFTLWRGGASCAVLLAWVLAGGGALTADPQSWIPFAMLFLSCAPAALVVFPRIGALHPLKRWALLGGLTAVLTAATVASAFLTLPREAGDDEPSLEELYG